MELNELKQLFSTQKVAVLATHGKKQAYANLVAFAASDDMKNLYFVTGRKTTKFANLTGEPEVAFLIDNRGDQKDFSKVAAVTVIGRAQEASGAEREECLKTFLGKHPYLKNFAALPDNAALRMTVGAYIISELGKPVSKISF